MDSIMSLRDALHQKRKARHMARKDDTILERDPVAQYLVPKKRLPGRRTKKQVERNRVESEKFRTPKLVNHTHKPRKEEIERRTFLAEMKPAASLDAISLPINKAIQAARGVHVPDYITTDAQYAEWLNAAKVRKERNREASLRGSIVALLNPPPESKRVKKRKNRKAAKQVKRQNTQHRSVHLSPMYVAYIKSEAWQDKRKEVFAIHGRQCVRCGGFKNLQCHHKTYERLGNENAKTDLEVLCLGCHEAEHGRKFGCRSK